MQFVYLPLAPCEDRRVAGRHHHGHTQCGVRQPLNTACALRGIYTTARTNPTAPFTPYGVKRKYMHRGGGGGGVKKYVRAHAKIYNARNNHAQPAWRVCHSPVRIHTAGMHQGQTYTQSRSTNCQATTTTTEKYVLLFFFSFSSQAREKKKKTWNKRRLQLLVLHDVPHKLREKFLEHVPFLGLG